MNSNYAYCRGLRDQGQSKRFTLYCLTFSSPRPRSPWFLSPSVPQTLEGRVRSSTMYRPHLIQPLYHPKTTSMLMHTSPPTLPKLHSLDMSTADHHVGSSVNTASRTPPRKSGRSRVRPYRSPHKSVLLDTPMLDHTCRSLSSDAWSQLRHQSTRIAGGLGQRPAETHPPELTKNTSEVDSAG